MQEDITTMDYDGLKLLKQQFKVPVKDLIANAQGNDPFYLPPARQKSGAWFKKVWDATGEARNHLREVHYWLISQKKPFPKRNGDGYQNLDNDWSGLGAASKSARYMGLLPFDDFDDMRNPEPIVYETDGIDYPTSIHRQAPYSQIFTDISFDMGNMPGLPCADIYHPDARQRYMVEIWCEKTTLNKILKPICSRYNCNLITGSGELSITAVDTLFKRMRECGKATRVIYISDFDPAGKSMPVAISRKVEFMIQQSGLDIDFSLDQLLLTEKQCKDYELPRVPLKPTERRKKKFEDKYGEGATELDAMKALHKDELIRIITEAVTRYRDPGLRKRIYQAGWEAEKQAMQDNASVREKYADEISEAKSTWEQIAEDAAEAVNEWRVEHQPLWNAMAKDLDGEFECECPQAVVVEKDVACYSILHALIYSRWIPTAHSRRNRTWI